MHNPIDVSKRVWDRLLQVREGSSCTCCGDFTESESLALELYGPLAERNSQQIAVGQIGQSLDGRVASSNGDSKQVSGPDGLQHLHRMRALVDGVIIGVKTAIHDSPRLTVRLCEGPNPARVVIDPSGRLPNDNPVLAENGARRIIIQSTDTHRPEGVEVVRLEAREGQFHPDEILSTLRTEGLNRLLVEGGGFTIGKFIDAQKLERIHIAISSILIGEGPAGLNLQQASPWLKDAVRPKTSAYDLGTDVVFDCDFEQRERPQQRNH